MKAKTIRTKVLSLLLAAVMVLGLMPVGALAASVDGSYTPGTYTGTAQGHKGDVTVTVTLAESDGAVVISDITATGESETPSYWAQAVTLLEQIKEKNGTDGVDAVSGATRSSNGIINAANEALGKAAAEISGSGTQTDPFVIMNASALAKFAVEVDSGNTYAGQYVVLGADIDLSGVESWNPIGAESAAADKIFRGTFNGGGHSITGLRIDAQPTSGEANYGLFSMLGNNAVVKNLNVTGASVSVSSTGDKVRAGIIAGGTEKVGTAGHANIGTRIDSCSATGSVSAVSKSDKLTYAGGIAGTGDVGTAITNCWTDASVSAVAQAVSNKNSMAGGIIGNSGNYAVIANCASFGDTYAASPSATNFGGMAGGLVGMMAGKQYNAYATGNATVGNGGVTHTWVGVLDGEVTSSGMSKDSAGSYTVYPAQGELRYGNYYASDALLKVEVYTGNGSTLGGTTVVDPTVDRGFSDKLGTVDKAMVSVAMSSTDMAESAFADTLNGNIKHINELLAAYGITGIALREWQLSGGRVLPTGSVWVSGDVDASIFASGDGSEASPYMIANAAQLRAFAGSMNDKIDYSGKYVSLGADIDLSGTQWSPIGGSQYAFNGTFDGNGHTVSGMTVGAENAPLTLDKENIYIGLFGVLGSKATVKNLSVTDFEIYASYGASAYIGGIAGYKDGSRTSGDFTGAVIDSCFTSGRMVYTGAKGNQFVGGIVGMQYKGAIINCASEVTASCVVASGDLAEIGGIAGLNNRGLVANCRTDSDLYGSGSRKNGDEGMAVVSNLVACNAGALVNSFAGGDTKTKEYSTYVGMVSGWVTGIGKTYNCWYDLGSTMFIGEDDVKQTVNPVEPIGTKVASGVNDEGDAYTGGLVDKMTGVKTVSADTANELNATFAAFPIDITAYGVGSDGLKKWVYDPEAKVLAFGSENANVTYVQPECEKVVKPELKLMDGTWYGRDDNKLSVVSIEVKNGEITATKVVSGQSEGEAYDAALAKAKYKATYGDFSTYEAADPSKFAGGSGTEADPYLIANEAQLRYLSSSINSDVSWKGVYFRQTADITLSDADWISIGWALNGEVNGKKTAICTYPFRGSYDGGGYTIYNLTVGSKDAPSDQMTSGLFGLAAGEVSTNELPADGQQTVTIKNVNLKDIDINVSTRYETFAGGLVGSGQGGIYIDNCTVQGAMSITTSESFCRAGGLAGSVLRGSVTNCGTDVNITAVTDTNHVYAGGLYGMDNRVTTLNCYALGDVTGNSSNNNKVHIGGLVGQAGGMHYNCYASGDVVSLKTTTDVGGLNGRSGGIASDYRCYFSTDSVQKQGDTVNSENVAVGVNANNNALVKDVQGKSAEELSGSDFAALLDSNIEEGAVKDAMAVLNKQLEDLSDRGYAQCNYYTGNQLLGWTVKNGAVVIGEDAYPFTDVDVNGVHEQYADAIRWAYNNGITTGAEQGIFKPDSGCTRAEVVTFLWRHAGEPEARAQQCAFVDVSKDAYYYKAVLWAAEKGITNGIDATHFDPNATVTRAQFVTFLWRYQGSSKVSSDMSFADVPQGAYYYDAVLWAAEKGITKGVGGDSFAPDWACLRAQVVTLIYRSVNAK